MRKMLNISFLFLASVLLVSQVSGNTFGSFPEELEKQSDDLKLEYRLNLVNLGDSVLEVTLESENSEEYNASFSENNFELEPSSVESSPEGSGWYHVGDGEYTKVRTVSIEVDVSEYRDSNNLVFPVQVRARPFSSEGGSVSSQVVRIREHSFRGIIDSSLRPKTREDGSDEEVRFWEEEQQEEGFNFEDSESTVEEEGGENRSKMNTSRSTAEENTDEVTDKESSGINTFTYLFVGGIAVSISYILLVV